MVAHNNKARAKWHRQAVRLSRWPELAEDIDAWVQHHGLGWVERAKLYEAAAVVTGIESSPRHRRDRAPWEVILSGHDSRVEEKLRPKVEYWERYNGALEVLPKSLHHHMTQRTLATLADLQAELLLVRLYDDRPQWGRQELAAAASHPRSRPLVQGLVWRPSLGSRKGPSFRIDEEGVAVDVNDEPLELCARKYSALFFGELDDEWVKTLVDYEIVYALNDRDESGGYSCR